MAATLDAVRDALGGHLSGRTHFDFLGNADPSTAFAPEALARLRRTKRERDPHGVFRSNRPVLPAAPYRRAQVALGNHVLRSGP